MNGVQFDGLEIVSFVHLRVRVLVLETLNDYFSEYRRESFKEKKILLAFGKSSVVDEELRKDDEFPIIFSEKFSSHFATFLSSRYETFEVLIGISAIGIEVWITLQDFFPEFFECWFHGGWLVCRFRLGCRLVVSVAWDVFPKFSFAASIANSPSDCFDIRKASSFR